MAAQLAPSDPRVKYETAEIRGKKYAYMLEESRRDQTLGTIILIHGWPDTSYTWRWTVDYLAQRGYRVVAPDMVGYAGTDAPADLKEYSWKSVATDIKELARKIVGNEQVILGGHDWGGAITWRVCLWYPELVKAAFVIGTPYTPPSETFVPLEDAVAKYVPSFGYQLQLRGPEAERRIQGPEKIRQLLVALHGGRTPDGQPGFSPKEGILFDNLDRLVFPEHETYLTAAQLDWYVEQFCRKEKPELRGPLNWYRTRELNFADERALASAPPKLEMPALFMAAMKDSVLQPWMSAKMEESFTRLTRKEVDGTHWAHWERSAEVNQLVGEWLDGLSRKKPEESL